MTLRYSCPPALAATVPVEWGADGVRWLRDLPRVLEGVTRAWHLAPAAPFDAAYHYVTPVRTADGTAAVLKLGVPTAGSLAAEVRALRAFDGHGAVRVLRADLDRGAVLLEFASPGTPLSRFVPARDREATAAAVTVMKHLHGAGPADGIPDLSTLTDDFDGYLAAHPDSGPLPRDLVDVAGGVLRELCASTTRRTLLHADLHHDNVLQATRAPWLAIDPHGYVGDPVAEVGVWLYNPDPADRDPALTALVPARCEQFADELAVPLDRVVAWGFVRAVLSDVWSAESWMPGRMSPASRALDVAQLLRPRLP